MSVVEARRRGPGRPLDPERVTRKREEILRAAAACFGADGYAGTDIDQIAAAAGITKGTVYHYFDSKEELFLAAVDHEANRLRLAVLAAADASSGDVDELAAVVHAYLAFFDSNPHVVELFVEERSTFKDRERHSYFVHRDMTWLRWLDLFRRMIDARVIRRVEPREITRVLSDALYGTVIANYFTHARRSAREQAVQIMNIVVGGLLVQPRDFSDYTFAAIEPTEVQGVN